MCWAYFGLVMAFVAEAVTGWWTNRMVRLHVIRRGEPGWVRKSAGFQISRIPS